MLNLRNAVQIRRLTETVDGFGGLSTSSTITTISQCNIWQPGGNDVTLSDKITSISTHVLAMLPDEYVFTDADREIIYGSITYKITGHPDDVANRGGLMIVGLERMT
jgi:hypothetical protein